MYNLQGIFYPLSSLQLARSVFLSLLFGARKVGKRARHTGQGSRFRPLFRNCLTAISFSRLNLVTNNFSSFARGETVRPPLGMSDTKSFTLFLVKDGYWLCPLRCRIFFNVTNAVISNSKGCDDWFCLCCAFLFLFRRQKGRIEIIDLKVCKRILWVKTTGEHRGKYHIMVMDSSINRIVEETYIELTLFYCPSHVVSKI